MLDNALMIKFALYGMKDPNVLQNAGFRPPVPKAFPTLADCKPASWLSPGTWLGSRKGVPRRASIWGVGVTGVLSATIEGTPEGESGVRSPTPTASGE